MQVRSIIRRGVLLTAVITLPKCGACLVGYVALAAGMATASPELCGGLDPVSTSLKEWLVGPAAFAMVAGFRGRRSRLSGMRGAVR